MSSSHPRRLSVGTGTPARPDAAASHTPARALPTGTGPEGARWRRGVQIGTGGAALLAVFSSGVLYGELHSDHQAVAVTAQPSAASPALPAAPPTATVIAQAPSDVPVTEPVGTGRGAPPVRISISALHIDQRLTGLRVKANRQLEVPQSYDDIGWWSTGPVPGDPGAAVIVGHVDGSTGPAVFSGLGSLTKGATVRVRRADGTTVKFAVTEVQTFAKDKFPDKLVYRTKGRSSLHLVTCGGRYDRATGYPDNVVVFADRVEPKTKSHPETTSKYKITSKLKTTRRNGG